MNSPLFSKKDLYLSYEEVDEKMTWCGGCGNYGIQKALFRALALGDITQKQCVICYDVGCSGNESDKLWAYTIHGLHGRVLPLAQGIHLANPDLTIIAHAGDGATFSEGVNHLVHAIRNDYNITFLHHNNGIYGLTTGQASSTTRRGQKANASSSWVLPDPLNPLELVLSLHPTFVARTFSGDVDHMTAMIQAGIGHQGFSFIDIAQACPTYNRSLTHEWYLEHLQSVDHIAWYDPANIEHARRAISDLDVITTGVLYHHPGTHFFARLPQRQGTTTSIIDEVRHYDITALISS
jgi:2-oxoglutarate/2-oxoacid ferredoxin oxidoreductase subunit beta